MEPERKKSPEQQRHREGLKHFLGAFGFVICLLGVLLGGKYLKFKDKDKTDFQLQKIFSHTVSQNTGNIIIIYHNNEYASESEINQKREKDKKAIFAILKKVGISRDECIKYSSFLEKYDEDLEMKKSIIEAEDLIFSIKYQLPIEQLISIIKNSKIEEKYKNNLLDSLDSEKKRLLKIWQTEAKNFPKPKNFEFALKQHKKLSEDLISKIESGKLEEKYKNEILNFLKSKYEKFLSRLKSEKCSKDKNQIIKSKSGKLFKSVDTLIIQTQNLNKFKGLKKIIGSILAENDMSGNISINNPSGKMLYIEFEMIPDKLLEVLENKYSENVPKVIKKCDELYSEERSASSEPDFTSDLTLESASLPRKAASIPKSAILQNEITSNSEIPPTLRQISPASLSNTDLLTVNDQPSA